MNNYQGGEVADRLLGEQRFMLQLTAVTSERRITCQLDAIFSDGHFIFVFLCAQAALSSA